MSQNTAIAVVGIDIGKNFVPHLLGLISVAQLYWAKKWSRAR